MGYYTTYELEASKEFIAELRATSENAEQALEEDGSVAEDSKRYEHDREIKKLSLKYPDELITLSGHGEDMLDIRKKYYKNGKVQFCPAVFDEFDESKLK